MMKRIILSICAALLPLCMFAEPIPAGYYDGIEGKQDADLKTTLSRICGGGERYDYGTTQYHSSSNPPEWEKGDLKAYGTWQALPLTDRREDGSIWDMYSNSVRYYPKKQGESGCSLNIEHCLPKSWWGGTVHAAYKDLYHLNPSDAQANSQKSNYPPGHVQKGDKFDNGSFRMDTAKSSKYGYICFEPAEEYRGDIARAYFYNATAYQDSSWSTDYSSKGYVDPNNYLFFSEAIQQVLLDWHRADPVSDKEICRAEQISSIQHNRNPFIDYPELVEYIWGNKKGQVVSLEALTCTYGTGTCHEYVPAEDPHIYDTLINLPGLTKAIVNALPNGFASEKIQSNGTVSITMGASTTDGWLSFNKLNLEKDAILAFRASIYNTAESMQIDVYAGNTKLRSIEETAVMKTRSEVRYEVTIPAGTDSISIVSVGGATTKRACMQELYLLSPKEGTDPTALPATRDAQPVARKEFRNGHMYIMVGNRTYSILGQ